MENDGEYLYHSGFGDSALPLVGRWPHGCEGPLGTREGPHRFGSGR